jgi:hypothetical protein
MLRVVWLSCWQFCMFRLHPIQGVKTLNVMASLPMSGNSFPAGGSCLPAVEMAIEHINARSDVLDGYHLNMTWKDTKVGGKAVRSSFVKYSTVSCCILIVKYISGICMTQLRLLCTLLIRSLYMYVHISFWHCQNLFKISVMRPA